MGVDGFITKCINTGVEELRRRAGLLRKMGDKCTYCPRQCKVNRNLGDRGLCGAIDKIRVASYNLHFGEEYYFVGRGGSGTVFFSWCNLGCCFCQNHDISHMGYGRDITVDDLAAVFTGLQEHGAENLNLVTPSHYPADIMEALALAVDSGFKLPVVWNSSGYDSVEVLRLFNGVVDVYMPDFKFASNELGAKLTAVGNYATVAKAALHEMVRQAGPELQIRDGIALGGISVRHLVLPGHYDDSRSCMEFLASISPGITVNVMLQYRPCYKAATIPGLDSRVDRAEYQGIIKHARELGMMHILEQA